MRLFTDENQNHPLYRWIEDTNKEKSSLVTYCAEHRWKLSREKLNHRDLENFELRGWQEEVLNITLLSLLGFYRCLKVDLCLCSSLHVVQHEQNFVLSMAQVWQRLRHLDNGLKSMLLTSGHPEMVRHLGWVIGGIFQLEIVCSILNTLPSTIH